MSRLRAADADAHASAIRLQRGRDRPAPRAVPVAGQPALLVVSMAASPREPDEDGLRITVGLKRLVLRRTDGAEEDDFKTWALTQLVTCDGRPWDELWYGRAAAEDGSDANLAKTSVTNGFEAAYNYKRRSKPVDIKHIAERLPGARMEVSPFLVNRPHAKIARGRLPRPLLPRPAACAGSWPCS